MPDIRIDLYSDTITRPTPEMRRFMCAAEVGNEQAREDPTVNRLVEMVAEILGKESAVYLPSGTMCNEIAFRVYCQPGDEIILDKTSHPLHFETGGPGALSGAMTYPLDGKRGIFTPGQVVAAIRPVDPHFPRSRVVSVEQTTNLGGGAVWPPETIRAVCAVAHKHGLAVHMDGARLFNAVVASGVSAKEFAGPVDSVWIDLTKGLGGPVGAVLAGSQSFIEKAWRWKHQFGGAMRQAGIIAAAGVYALQYHIERLAEDHTNAKWLAHALAEIPGIDIDPAQVETNLVYFDVAGTGMAAAEFHQRLLGHGVRVSLTGPGRLRAVTHLDVSRADVEEAAQIIRQVAQEGQNNR